MRRFDLCTSSGRWPPRGASYGNEVERFIWAPSQTNEIFSGVNTSAIRLQHGQEGAILGS